MSGGRDAATEAAVVPVVVRGGARLRDSVADAFRRSRLLRGAGAGVAGTADHRSDPAPPARIVAAAGRTACAFLAGGDCDLGVRPGASGILDRPPCDEVVSGQFVDPAAPLWF